MTDKEVLTRQLDHMAAKLLEEGQRMKEEALIVEYDNGGGQSGVRENPYYPAYEKLFSSFTKGIAALREMGDADPAEVSSLDVLRAKLKVAK